MPVHIISFVAQFSKGVNTAGAVDHCDPQADQECYNDDYGYSNIAHMKTTKVVSEK